MEKRVDRNKLLFIISISIFVLLLAFAFYSYTKRSSSDSEVSKELYSNKVTGGAISPVVTCTGDCTYDDDCVYGCECRNYKCKQKPVPASPPLDESLWERFWKWLKKIF